MKHLKVFFLDDYVEKKVNAWFADNPNISLLAQVVTDHYNLYIFYEELEQTASPSESNEGSFQLHPMRM